jgi:hypothetical protein
MRQHRVPDAGLSLLEVAPGRDVRQAERRDGYLWCAVDHEGEGLCEKPGEEQRPSIATKRMCDEAVPPDEIVTEVQLGSCQLS